MPDALLDIIGVVPVQLVFAYALTKMLNIRRLYLFWVLELVFVLLISSFRSSMSVEFRLAASVPLALIPIFLSQGSLARRILVVTLAHLVLFFAELPGGALWMSMTGTPVADYEAVRTHLGAFFLTHAAHMALLVPLLAMLCMLLNRFGSAQERGMGEWLPVLFSLVQLVLVNVMILLPLGYIQESMTQAWCWRLSVSRSICCCLRLWVASPKSGATMSVRRCSKSSWIGISRVAGSSFRTLSIP